MTVRRVYLVLALALASAASAGGKRPHLKPERPAKRRHSHRFRSGPLRRQITVTRRAAAAILSSASCRRVAATTRKPLPQ